MGFLDNLKDGLGFDSDEEKAQKAAEKAAEEAKDRAEEAAKQAKEAADAQAKANEAKAKADGKVTKAEKARLHAAQDKQSRRIAKQKHDKQHAK